MAGRVNVKFVISLSIGLLLAFGVVAGSAYFLLANKASDLARAGDKAVAAGDLDRAIELYSKAVNKEQTNSVNIEKWRDTLKKRAPEIQVTYASYFNQYLLGTRALARVQKDNIAVQREYLDLLRENLPKEEFNRGSVDNFITESSVIIGKHDGEPKGSPSGVLKRFRGAAKCELYRFVPDAKVETANEAEADLLDALAADPADGESVAALQGLYLTMANRATARSATDEASALEKKADALVDEYAAKNPTEPLIQLIAIQRDWVRERDQLAAKARQNNLDITAFMALLKPSQAVMKPRLDGVLQAAMALPPEKIQPRLVSALRSVEASVDPASRGDRAEKLLLMALEKHPDDWQFLAARADMLADRDDYTNAAKELQKIQNIKLPNTSLEGLRLFSQKNSALFLQTLFEAKSWQFVPEAQKQSAIDAAKLSRTKLGAVMPADSPPLLFVDAQIAFVEGDNAKANRLLDQYIKIMGARTSPDALYLSAQVADRINQLGLAKQRLEETLKVAPGRLAATFMLADVEARLQNNDRARELYQQLFTYFPDNELLKQRISQLDMIAGRATTSGATADPVTVALIEADRFTKPRPGETARPEELIPFLEKAAEKYAYDWRLVSSLANAYLRQGERDKALSLIKKARGLHPESKELQKYEVAVTTRDPVENRLALIELEDVSELDKVLSRYGVLRAAGRDKAAEEEMAKAMKAAPNDKRVIEFRFLDAIDDKRFDDARKLAEQAEKQNMDEADGLTFRARLSAAQGNYKDAVAAMTQAVAKGGALPETWRLKGRMEQLLGRRTDAVESFRQAVKLRPGDVPAINDLLAALNDLGKTDEALTVARESEKYGRDDDQFVAMWLALESSGGNKAAARDKREIMSKNSPNDRANLIALAGLYIGDRDWAKARPIIDRARALGEGYDVVAIDAMWNWEQGDREKARKLFETFIDAQDPAKAGSTPLLMYAQFLAQRQDYPGALAVLDKARAKQDPKTAEADRAIVEVYMRTGDFENAVEVCRRIVTSGADTPDMTYQKRMAEALIKLGTPESFASALTELEKVTKAGEPDAVTMLLIADCKAGLKDTKGQRKILDDAVSRFPGDPIVFLKRGQSQIGDKKTARDAISDLNKVLQLRPDSWQAYRLRAAANVTLEQIDDAVKDLRAAVKIAPYNDDLLYGLVADLMRMGRTSDAVDIATEAVKSRPRDVDAMVQLGQIFAQAGAHPEACQFYKQAFDIETADKVSQRYLDSLLAQPSPDLAEVGRVFQKIGTDRVTKSPGFLMAFAKAAMKQKKPQVAEGAARDALNLLRADEPTVMLAWFNDLRRLIPDKKVLLKYLEDTSKMAQAALAQEWIEYFRLSVQLDDPATRKDAVEPARKLLARAKDESIKQLLYRATSSALYAAGDHEEAARAMREGLGQFPNDVELSNNLAYCLAVDLNKPAEAVELAEKASKLAPAVADVQDTLGVVYLKNKRLPDSIAAFRRALLLSSSPEQSVKYCMHLAEAHAAAGAKPEARAALLEAGKTIEANPSAVSEKTKAEFEDMRKKFETQ